MTNEQIQKVFHKAVAMCDESGFHANSLVQTVGYHRKKNAFATCYTHRDMFGTCSNIKVSKYYAEKASEQQMLNTLVHEVLHACFPRENHGGKWAKAAAVMNRKYGLDISRCADYKDENGESILNNESLAKYIIKCPKCGQTICRSRACKLVNHPDWFRCSICNVSLVRIK